jgi:hypothetical protein
METIVMKETTNSQCPITTSEKTVSAESDPDWRTLQDFFCADFMYIGGRGSLKFYKHKMTRQYLNINSETGVCFRHVGNGNYTSISKDEALKIIYGR